MKDFILFVALFCASLTINAQSSLEELLQTADQAREDGDIMLALSMYDEALVNYDIPESRSTSICEWIIKVKTEQIYQLDQSKTKTAYLLKQLHEKYDPKYDPKDIPAAMTAPTGSSKKENKINSSEKDDANTEK